jgi:hypothetical protein
MPNIPDGHMIISALAALKLYQAGHLKPEDMQVMNIAGEKYMTPTAIEPGPLLPVSFEIDGIPWECPAEKGVLVPVDVFQDVDNSADTSSQYRPTPNFRSQEPQHSFDELDAASVVYVRLPSTYGYLCPNDSDAILYARSLLRDDVQENVLRPEVHGSILDLCEVVPAPYSTLGDVCWELFMEWLPPDDD